ncbi:hypothetical protein BURK1_03143 [Burkholderiales bacterium]|nr:hypothetical protein BURK1_03143 [Burkholderiales bacterium]
MSAAGSSRGIRPDAEAGMREASSWAGPGEAVNLMIATPAYGGMVHTDYTMTLLELRAAGVAFSLVTMGNESLITRARNALLAAFHARPEFTHLLFLDADVGLPAAAVVRLLAHRRDVVAAPVPLKGRGPDGERLFNVGRAVGEDGPLTLHEHAGTAVLLLSRRAVDALVEEAKADGRVYDRMTTLAGDPGTRVHYDVFRVGVVDGEYLSEDFWACATLRRLGHAIHVDPAIVVRHHGTVPV